MISRDKLEVPLLLTNESLKTGIIKGLLQVFHFTILTLLTIEVLQTE